MTLPLTYNVRNVLVRWRATAATIFGVALVVAVFVLVQALAVGLQKASQNTGDPRNLMIVRKGSTAESSSQVSREQFRTFEYFPQIARDNAGRALVSADAWCWSACRAARVAAKPMCPCAASRPSAWNCARRFRW